MSSSGLVTSQVGVHRLVDESPCHTCSGEFGEQRTTDAQQRLQNADRARSSSLALTNSPTHKGRRVHHRPSCRRLRCGASADYEQAAHSLTDQVRRASATNFVDRPRAILVPTRRAEESIVIFRVAKSSRVPPA